VSGSDGSKDERGGLGRRREAEYFKQEGSLQPVGFLHQVPSMCLSPEDLISQIATMLEVKVILFVRFGPKATSWDW
jgi:hypothetical protein